MLPADGFVRVLGDGLAVRGACVVKGILWRCDKNNEECKVYDGRDATSGRLFASLIGGADSLYHFDFGDGVVFHEGVYVDQTTNNDEFTVYFTQGI